MHAMSETWVLGSACHPEAHTRRLACIDVDMLSNATRVASTRDWCDCGTGLANITVWPADANRSVATTRSIGGREAGGLFGWIDWGRPVGEVSWLCDGMRDVQHSSLVDGNGAALQHWSVSMLLDEKKGACGKTSGRIRFAGWRSSPTASAVPFSSGESGYNCIKIPVLLSTAAGTLLAMAEARRHSCSDFAWTDLVLKRSSDGGATWSALSVIRSESGPGLPHTVIGNAAPVQLSAAAKHSGRILLPHTRNNSEVWLSASDDDGATWSAARLLPNLTSPSPGASQWAWVGTGPPGALQLRGGVAPGRVVVPSYHSRYRGNVINNLVHGHTLLSDDEGASWRVGSPHGFGAADKFANENQMVELYPTVSMYF